MHLGKEASPQHVQADADAQVAPKQREQHVLRIAHRRRHGRVRATAQLQPAHACRRRPPAAPVGSVSCGEEQAWQRNLTRVTSTDLGF